MSARDLFYLVLGLYAGAAWTMAVWAVLNRLGRRRR